MLVLVADKKTLPAALGAVETQKLGRYRTAPPHQLRHLTIAGDQLLASNESNARSVRCCKPTWHTHSQGCRAERSGKNDTTLALVNRARKQSDG